MDPVMIGVIGLMAMVSLIMIRVPIGCAMALVGLTGFSILSSPDAAFSMLGMVTYQTASSYALTVIPLFFLMGQLASQSGMGIELYRTVYRWIGFMPGGLAMATVCACAGFAAVSGSSLATAATVGMVALPEMKRFRYDDALATGCVAAGGTLGILIPPSTVMVIYGILTEQPIGTLFIAGIIPGIILTGLFLLTIFIQTRKEPDMGPPGPKFSFAEKLESLKDTGSVIVTFALVVGGLYEGWFAPTEAAAVGALIVLVIIFVKRKLTRELLTSSLTETALSTAMIFTILIGANIFSYFMALSDLPATFSGWITGTGMNRYLTMFIICLVYIFLGCIMEGFAIMFLTLPIVFPMVIGMGFDPIWFGVLMTLLIEMGLITPPVGINVYVISGVARDVPMATIFRGIFPFFIAMLVCMVLLLLFPQLALLLPATMAG
jgi:tripartite ATP-independent transporter DctM subunit